MSHITPRRQALQMTPRPSVETLNRLIEYFEGVANDAGRWEMPLSDYPKMADQLGLKEATLRRYLAVLVSADILTQGTRSRAQKGISAGLDKYIVFVLKHPGARMERTRTGLQIAKQE